MARTSPIRRLPMWVGGKHGGRGNASACTESGRRLANVVCVGRGKRDGSVAKSHGVRRHRENGRERIDRQRTVGSHVNDVNDFATEDWKVAGRRVVGDRNRYEAGRAL